MKEAIKPSSGTADCELVTTRLIDAPRELVYQAFIEPEHLKHWWGPKGFTNTFQEFDPRPDGTWRFVMHGPDGKDYQNQHLIRELVKPERIVLQHVSAPRFQLTITLAEEAGKTRLDWRMLFDTAAECARVQRYAVDANEQNLDRLEAELKVMGEVERPFSISRAFDAPRELVWSAWSERERLMEWFGPKGFTMSVANLDFRPNGAFHYCLRAPDGQAMWGKFVYREIVKPERIVLVNSFSDSAGGLTRHPMSPTWPLEMLSSTLFTEQDGGTLITVTWRPLKPTEEEHRTFNAAHDGMRQGWTGTFEQLADYLAKAKSRAG